MVRAGVVEGVAARRQRVRCWRILVVAEKREEKRLLLYKDRVNGMKKEECLGCQMNGNQRWPSSGERGSR